MKSLVIAASLLVLGPVWAYIFVRLITAGALWSYREHLRILEGSNGEKEQQ